MFSQMFSKIKLKFSLSLLRCIAPAGTVARLRSFPVSHSTMGVLGPKICPTFWQSLASTAFGCTDFGLKFILRYGDLWLRLSLASTMGVLWPKIFGFDCLWLRLRVYFGLHFILCYGILWLRFDEGDVSASMLDVCSRLPYTGCSSLCGWRRCFCLHVGCLLPNFPTQDVLPYVDDGDVSASMLDVLLILQEVLNPSLLGFVVVFIVNGVIKFQQSLVKNWCLFNTHWRKNWLFTRCTSCLKR